MAVLWEIQILLLLVHFVTPILSAAGLRSRHPWHRVSNGRRYSTVAWKRQRVLSYDVDPLQLTLRGGSTGESVATTTRDAVDVEQQRAYRLQQHLYLNSRSLQLRQALINRGLTELSHTAQSSSGVPAAVDWECAVSTAKSPKSCLYSLDAEEGQKVICPAVMVGGSIAAHQQRPWITVTALNRLRRTDPQKVEPLWHGQYRILDTWFGASHPYSVRTHLSARAALVSLALDAPRLATGAILLILFLFSSIVFLPALETAVKYLAVSGFIWRTWPSWSRFVHAALPLQLLLGQITLGGVARILSAGSDAVRHRLIEMECRLLQECLPVTIVENDNVLENEDSRRIGLDDAEEDEDE